MTTQPTFEKVIRYDSKSRDYGMYLDGELIGFARTYHEAEMTLDQVAFERLTHGDCATATELDGGAICPTCEGDGRIPADGCGDQAGGWAETCPDCNGNLLMPEGDILDVNGMRVARLVASDPPGENPLGDDEGDSTPSAVNWNSAACVACHTLAFPPSSIFANVCVACANARYFGLSDRFAAQQLATNEPPAEPTPPVDDGDEDNWGGFRRPLACTRQSIAIEAKLTTCGYCAGIHHVQTCPELRTHLRASDADWRIAVGRKLCAMFWREHAAFVALLLNATPDQLLTYAASYLAFIKDHNQRSDLTINDVIRSWSRLMGGDRGPAAPAVQLRAA